MGDGVTSKPNRRPLYALLAASAISLTGNNLTALAIPWFVLQTTGSAVQTGITGAVGILPIVLSSFFGGGLVDRLGYKRASIVADLASMLSVALIPLLYLLGWLPFPVLLTLVFLGALLDAPGSTARQALTPELAAAAGWTIEQCTSAMQVVERGSRLLGAPLAGVLIALLGAAGVLWVDAATFLVSAALVAVAVPTAPLKPRAEDSRYLTELVDGLRFIRNDQLIRTLLVLLMITNFLDIIWSAVIAPVYASEVYDSPVALGLLFGASGGGAVVGALLYGAYGSRFPRFPIFVGGFVLAASSSLFLAFFPPLGVAVAIKAITALGAGPLNPILGALPLERVPETMRGRVLGVITAGAFLTMPLGALVAGPVLNAVGLQTTLLLIGGAYVLTTASMLFVPAIRQMDSSRGQTPAPA